MLIEFEELGIIIPDKEGNLIKFSIIQLRELNQDTQNET